MNYPGGARKKNNVSFPDVKTSHQNRGMTLEGELNDSNEYYRAIGKAYIYKKPTPIQITESKIICFILFIPLLYASFGQIKTHSFVSG